MAGGGVGALDGIRVLDLSRYAPGPYCTMLLADFGADVVMVEEPPGGARRVDTAMRVSERQKAFLPTRRNKRSIVLDLKAECEREAFFRLLDTADVVVEGFRPGVAARLGVDYERVRERNPRIVYCSITGYGQTGPYAGLVGHDLNYISLAGVLGMIGWPGQAPAIPLNVIADFAGGGLFAAFAVLAAVLARQHTGRGQYIDMAMTDGALSLACLAASEHLRGADAPRPGEYFLNGALPCYNVYECAGGKWLSIACMEPWFWKNLCTALGCEQYTEDQFNATRFEETFRYLRRRFKEKSRDAWFAELNETDTCVTPVYSIDEALDDEHVRAREMVVEFDDARHGKVRQVGIAPKLSETPGRVGRPAPRPGEHGEEVLREAGFETGEIASILGSCRRPATA